MPTKTSEEWSAAFGFLYIEEVAALKELAAGLPPAPTVVNVGAGTGTSGLALLEAREDLFVFTVDIVKGVSPTGGLGNELYAYNKSDIDPSRYCQIHGDSKEVADNWSGKMGLSIDMIFIDGEHDHAYVEEEGPLWWANLKPGGVMAFHDYDSVMWGGLVGVIDNMGFGDPILQVKTIVAFRKEEETDESN
jgi:predicted O-methyltransferase YrrM